MKRLSSTTVGKHVSNHKDQESIEVLEEKSEISIRCAIDLNTLKDPIVPEECLFKHPNRCVSRHNYIELVKVRDKILKTNHLKKKSICCPICNASLNRAHRVVRNEWLGRLIEVLIQEMKVDLEDLKVYLTPQHRLTFQSETLSTEGFELRGDWFKRDIAYHVCRLFPEQTRGIDLEELMFLERSDESKPRSLDTFFTETGGDSSTPSVIRIPPISTPFSRQHETKPIIRQIYPPPSPKPKTTPRSESNVFSQNKPSKTTTTTTTRSIPFFSSSSPYYLKDQVNNVIVPRMIITPPSTQNKANSSSSSSNHRITFSNNNNGSRNEDRSENIPLLWLPKSHHVPKYNKKIFLNSERKKFTNSLIRILNALYNVELSVRWVEPVDPIVESKKRYLLRVNEFFQEKYTEFQSKFEGKGVVDYWFYHLRTKPGDFDVKYCDEQIFDLIPDEIKRTLNNKEKCKKYLVHYQNKTCKGLEASDCEFIERLKRFYDDMRVGLNHLHEELSPEARTNNK